jgi:hypothetical protein
MPILPTQNKLTYYASLVGFIITIITAYFAIDSHYAKAAEVKKLELRLEQKIVADRSEKLQERIWKFEDRYPDKSKAPREVQEAWRVLEKELATNDYILKTSIEK